MWWRAPYNPTAYDDDWEDQPGQGWFYQWALGAVLPGIMVAYGVHCMLTLQAVFGNRPSIPLHGLDAAATGAAAVSVGLFMHFHYFWGNVYNQAWWAVLGKIISACGFIAGLGVMIVRVGVFGK